MKVESTYSSKTTCRVVCPGPEIVTKQGHLSSPGISAESVGAQRIHLQVVIIPPGVRAKAHKHDGHESAIHILSGKSGMWYGERLEEHLTAKAGDFVYIPADTPHLPYNLSTTETCVAVIARTDPNEQESVILLPELDGIYPLIPIETDPIELASTTLSPKTRSGGVTIESAANAFKAVNKKQYSRALLG